MNRNDEDTERIMSRQSGSRRWIGSAGLLGVVGMTAVALTVWKSTAIGAADAAAASQPEPIETVTTAVAVERPYHETTTSIGTVLALRSITLRNEVAGLVREVSLVPGDVVDAGAVLVALDVSVEEAELAALEAQAGLAETTLGRLERLRQDGAASEEEVDHARAERDVALAQVERTRAVIARKTIRAPFRARVGIADVHPGQYLNEGTQLTTLQGVDGAVHVDFAVAQQVAAGLREGQPIEVVSGTESIPAVIVAIDARVDAATRNAIVRARMRSGAAAPGASVRVIVPVGGESAAVLIPATALRKGPAGDHVFVVAPDAEGRTRAHVRPVQSGAMVGDQVVITHGLEAGELIASQGSFKLFESIAVNVVDGGEAVGGAR
jgi:membrane fusion protein (multidrug efflux system)